jgi:hypothetical protein
MFAAVVGGATSARFAEREPHGRERQFDSIGPC